MFCGRRRGTPLNKSLDSAIGGTIAYPAFLIWPGQKTQGVEPNLELGIYTKKGRRQPISLCFTIQFPDTVPGKFEFSRSWLEKWIVLVQQKW